MEKNPSYEDSKLPEYDEIQLQNIRSNANEANISTSINRTNLKSKSIALVVVLSLLAIAIVAAIGLCAYALVSSNQGMDSVMLDIQELKMQLNKKEESEKEIAKLKNDFENGLNTLTMEKNATMALLNSLQSSVNTLEGVLNGSGPGRVSAAINAISSLQSSVSSLNTANGATTTHLNSLQSSVSSLTTRVNSPVNLYQNCIQETESCTDAQSGSAYSEFCVTPYLPVNKSGYYTLSMECKYDAVPLHLDTSTLRQLGSIVDCLCWTTTGPSSTGVHASTIFRTFTCTLVITRCPTSQNIV